MVGEESESFIPITEDAAIISQSTHGLPMTLDADSDDRDSAIGESPLPSTKSVSSSIYAFIEENGRKYHSFREGSYYLPNDEEEQSRLELQHHSFLLTLDGALGLAPVVRPQQVLDMGTGTGIWAIEYALQHPESTVTGVDLSPIQPDFVPPNCQFEIDDLEDEWAYSHPWNYIHGRALFTCFKNPLGVIQQAYASLAPGGYLELQDVYFNVQSIDETINGTTLRRFNDLVIAGAAKIGRDWYCTKNYAQWLRDAGFVDVVERQFAWPIGQWPRGKKQKTLGLWTMTNGLEGAAAIGTALLTRLGMSLEEVGVLIEDVKRDLRDRSIHSYWPVYVVYGRKPL